MGVYRIIEHMDGFIDCLLWLWFCFSLRRAIGKFLHASPQLFEGIATRCFAILVGRLAVVVVGWIVVVVVGGGQGRKCLRCMGRNGGFALFQIQNFAIANAASIVNGQGFAGIVGLGDKGKGRIIGRRIIVLVVIVSCGCIGRDGCWFVSFGRWCQWFRWRCCCFFFLLDWIQGLGGCHNGGGRWWLVLVVLLLLLCVWLFRLIVVEFGHLGNLNAMMQCKVGSIKIKVQFIGRRVGLSLVVLGGRIWSGICCLRCCHDRHAGTVGIDQGRGLFVKGLLKGMIKGIVFLRTARRGWSRLVLVLGVAFATWTVVFSIAIGNRRGLLQLIKMGQVMHGLLDLGRGRDQTLEGILTAIPPRHGRKFTRFIFNPGRTTIVQRFRKYGFVALLLFGSRGRRGGGRHGAGGYSMERCE